MICLCLHGVADITHQAEQNDGPNHNVEVSSTLDKPRAYPPGFPSHSSIANTVEAANQVRSTKEL